MASALLSKTLLQQFVLDAHLGIYALQATVYPSHTVIVDINESTMSLNLARRL